MVLKEIINKRFTDLGIKYQFAILSFFSFLICNFVIFPYWRNHIDIIHTWFETVCVFIALSSFCVLMLTYRVTRLSSNSILSFGFLLVAEFDLLHIISFEPLNNHSVWNIDLSIKFWILCSIIEALMLLAISVNSEKFVWNKWTTLAVMVIGVNIVTYLACYQSNLLQGLVLPTVLKTILEYLVIVVYTVTLLNLKCKIKNKNIAIYRYIFIGLLFGIMGELCVTLCSSFESLFYLWGHMLKIIFYWYLFIGIFHNTVIYPYEEVRKLYIEGEERYKSSFDNLTMGVVLTDLTGKIVKINRFLLDILGYSEEELLGLIFSDTILRGDNCIKDDYLRALLENDVNKIVSFERRYKHKYGYDVWLEVNVALVNDLMEKPKYFLYEIQDISSNKKVVELEIGMQDKRKELRDTIEMDKLRVEFFANLSHELRTPINVISGAIQLIELNLKDNMNENTIRNVNFIKQNSRRLLRLVNNLIDATKLEVGFYELNLRNFDIVSLVENISLGILEYTSLKNIQLIFDTDVEEKIILCDPNKIERIILNLLSNSLKFTNSGGSIIVNLYDRIDNIVIAVRDTGVGIPKDKQELIFERFRQVDKSFTKNSEGSGIGLAIVKALVELHGGRIEVESDIGMGSEFSITLPAYSADNEEIGKSSEIDLDRVERVKIEFSDISA
jgi:PAS domain S-box-containing protein